jgi:tetratricopeptide (TPR) repeat protein
MDVMQSFWRFAVPLVLGCLTASAQSASSRSKSVLPSADVQTMQEATEALRSGHMDAAIAGFQKITQDAPRFAEGYLNLGLALSQVSRDQEAVAALQKATALKPSLRGAALFLAISEYRLNHFDTAALAIRKETALDPADAQAWMWQGIIDLAQAKLARAVEEFDHAYSLAPNNVDILYHRGRAALALSRQSYEDMFKLDPHSWHVHQVLAEADVESDHDADAVEQYKQAIASAPVQSGLYEAMGSSLWRSGKFQEAEQAFEEALKIDPNDTLTLYKLGCLRVDRGDAAGGKPLLLQAIAADPSLKLSSYYLGRAESELGENSQAVADFNKIIAENVDPDTTKQAYFQLSRVYRKLHDNAEAASAQATYRQLDQKSKDAMQTKVAQRRLRADRDTSIPSPSSEPDGTNP